MEKSKASEELEQFARNVDGTHEDFVRFMGQVPQIDGVDEKLAEFIRENPDASHDDVLFRYCELAILRRD